MIRGPILRVVAFVTLPFATLLTLYFLVSGHNNPGGGFIAGVLMSGAIALQFLAYGREDAPKFLKLRYERVVAAGFVIAVVAASAPLLAGYPFLTSFHATVDVPILGAKMEFALAQLFDFGIFLLVAGGVMTAVLGLAGEGEGPSPQSSPRMGEEGRGEKMDSGFRRNDGKVVEGEEGRGEKMDSGFRRNDGKVVEGEEEKRKMGSRLRGNKDGEGPSPQSSPRMGEEASGRGEAPPSQSSPIKGGEVGEEGRREG